MVQSGGASGRRCCASGSGECRAPRRRPIVTAKMTIRSAKNCSAASMMADTAAAARSRPLPCVTEFASPSGRTACTTGMPIRSSPVMSASRVIPRQSSRGSKPPQRHRRRLLPVERPKPPTTDRRNPRSMSARPGAHCAATWGLPSFPRENATEAAISPPARRSRSPKPEPPREGPPVGAATPRDSAVS